MQDEPTGVPINRATRFENKVGSLDVVVGKSLIKKRAAAKFNAKFGSLGVVVGKSLIKRRILERLFIDVVAGESLIKKRAAAKFNAKFGSLGVVAGEPLFLLPRRFRQNRAWIEINKICRRKTKVKGFFLKKIKGGYKVALAGFIAFLPFRHFNRRKKYGISNNRFIIQTMKPKKGKNYVVV
jgi:hypothetical protein